MPGKNETICIFTNDISAVSETFVRRHVHSLHGGRTVVMTRKGLELFQKERPVFAWKKRNFLFGSLFDPNNPESFSSSLFRQVHGCFLGSLGEFIKRHQVRCIIAEFGTSAVRLHKTARYHNVPLFCYFRGFDASRRLKDAGYVRRLKEMMPGLAGVFAVSRFLVANLEEKGVSHPNTLVIPSGVDTEEFVPKPKDRDLLLSVGRFVEKKCPHKIIEAFEMVRERFPRIRLEMIGDGPLLKDCIKLAGFLDRKSKITFHGAKSHEFVRERLSAANIFLQHSVTAKSGDAEGLPSSIQEAMASGCAILATRHAGIPEIITHGENGVLVEERDGKTFSNELGRLLEDGELCTTLSRNARAYAEQHLEFRALFSELEKGIDRALSGGRSR